MLLLAPEKAVAIGAMALTGVVACCLGSRVERLGFAMLAANFIAAPILEARDSWINHQIATFVSDLAFLAVLIAMSRKHDQAWIIVAAGIQLIYCALYLPFWLNPKALYRGFYYAGTVLGYLLEGTLIGGSLLEGRRCPTSR